MIILTLRTDKPQAEIGLYEDANQAAYQVWEAHRALAETLHTKINELLQSKGKKLADIDGIVIFKGPGSFTGLRIGASVANALAYSQRLPIIGEKGDEWLISGINKLLAGQDHKLIAPEYGNEAFVTKPRQ